MQRLEHAKIVTMNGSRAVFEEAAPVVDAGRIAAIGSTEDLRRAYPQAQAIDLNQRLVMPELIDAHNHPFNYLVGGYGDDLPIDDLLYNVFYPYERFVTPDDAYVGALAAYAEMIRSGVTCFNDPGGYMPDMVGAAAGTSACAASSIAFFLRGGAPPTRRRSCPPIVSATRQPKPFAQPSPQSNAGTAPPIADCAPAACARHCRPPTIWSAKLAISAAPIKSGCIRTRRLQPQGRSASLKKFGKRTFDRYRDLGLMGLIFTLYTWAFSKTMRLPTWRRAA